MTDYDKFLTEIEKEKQERIEHECKKGSHNWTHGYNFAYCSRCGIDQEDFQNS